MSIKHGLLALLSEGPKYGYQLRAEFEERTGVTWPLNVGQVYTTLGRLERDSLVVPLETDNEGRHRYSITDEGRAEVAVWFAAPVPRDSAPRDELAIKLAIALTVPGVDVTAMVQTQRSETMRTLQNYTRLKSHADDAELAWMLALDALLFQAEAELRWLDHCGERLARAIRPATPTNAASQPASHVIDPTGVGR
ncbi:MAG: PadR family transcriptional regulator [Actinomycetia bacterium]|nr:PadR family transcriptional regulator [Actinomycetes bacterium]